MVSMGTGYGSLRKITITSPLFEDKEDAQQAIEHQEQSETSEEEESQEEDYGAEEDDDS